MGFLIFILIIIAAFGATTWVLGLIVSMLIAFVFQKSPECEKWQSYGKYATYFGIPVWVIVSIFMELHPDDTFYLKEFSRASLRQPPSSSKVVAQSASMFSLRNEYCAYSRIEISPEDYSRLLAEIDADRPFISREKRSENNQDGKRVTVEESKIWETENQHDVWEAAKYISVKSSYVRPVPSDQFQHFSLLFLIDGKHVEVNSCRT